MPPDLPFARAARRPRLSRGISFWLLGAIQLLLLFAAGAPSPLYPLYQAEWGFGPTAVTLVFALYAFGLLAALLVVGSLSDHVGRRPVLIVSLLVEIAAMVVFIEAAGLGWLLVARGIQGLATGAAMGAIGAGLVDLQPLHKPRLGPLVSGTSILLGLALGGLGAGVLVRYAPAPTMLVYLLLIAAFASPSPAWCSCRRRPRDGPVLSAHSCAGRRCPVGCVRTSWSSRQASWLSGPSAVSISRWDPH
ncbi:MFS transporter [Streptomyces sp. MN13]